VTALADRSLQAVTADLAAATPSPGGGCAAAWTCAFAAALVEMAAATAAERGGADPAACARAAPRAAELRERALALAEQDAAAYAPVLAALREPVGPERERHVAAALDAAAGPPLTIAETAAEVAELAVVVARAGRASLAGDVGAGAVLAEGAARAAARLVELDLAGRPGDPRLARAGRAVSRAVGAREAGPP
jgi:methenyltetrahydrofolate cyclohydrolase